MYSPGEEAQETSRNDIKNIWKQAGHVWLLNSKPLLLYTVLDVSGGRCFALFRRGFCRVYHALGTCFFVLRISDKGSDSEARKLLDGMVLVGWWQIWRSNMWHLCKHSVYLIMIIHRYCRCCGLGLLNPQSRFHISEIKSWAFARLLWISFLDASGHWSILIWVQGCAKLANVSSRTSFMPAMLAVHRAYYRDPSSLVSVKGRGWHKYQACPSYLLNWVWEVIGFAESENHRQPNSEEVRNH